MKEAFPSSLPADEPQSALGFTPREVLTAVRRRWWVVATAFAVIVAAGLWRTMREPHIYESSATVRIQQSQSPISGVQSQAPTYDYRVDPLTSEQQVIRSRVVADRVVEQEGLRLRIAQPEGVRRTAIFGDSTPVVDSATRVGDYLMQFGEREYSLRSGPVQYGSVPYGRTLRAAGMTLFVPSRPEIGESEVLLEVLPLASASAEVRNGIATTVVPQTNIIQIAYYGTDPRLVRDVANAVARSYQQVSSEMQRTNAKAKSLFIAGTIRDQEVLLREAQDALKQFKEREQVGDIGTEQGAHFVRIQRIEQDRQDALVEQKIYATLVGKLAEADTIDEDLRKLVGTQAVNRNQYVANLYNQWFELIKRREELFAQGRNSLNNDVRAVDRLITRTKEDLQSASRLYLQALESRLGSLDKTVSDLRAETERFPSLEAEQARLEAKVRTLQNTYENLQSEYQFARIAESVDGGSVQVLDEAPLPTFAVSPNRRRAVAYSMMLGLIVGLGLALLLERMDDSVRSPDELRDHLDLPLLGLIPAIKGERGKPSTANAIAARSRLITHGDPRSPVAEAYRSLRTNLAFARTQQTTQAIVVASPGPADGKSTTAANLAITFAQQGQRTLLIDADLRRAVLDKTFDVPRSPGLTEVIIGDATLDAATHETQVPNLFLVASGTFPPNPSELLGSARMQAVLKEAKGRFDIVLLDSPPLLAVTDGAVLSTLVDGTVLVVRTGATKRDAVRRALGHVRAVHGRLLGAVLNDVDIRSGAYYGGYGHYYYSYYGSEPNGGNGSGRDAVRRLRRIVGRSSKASREG